MSPTSGISDDESPGGRKVSSQESDDEPIVRTPSQVERRKAEVLCEGALEIVKKRKGDTRYFVLFETHVEYYTDQTKYYGGALPRGKIMHRDIHALEGKEDSVLAIGVGDRTFNLRAMDVSDLKRWGMKWAAAIRAGGREDFKVVWSWDVMGLDSKMSKTRSLDVIHEADPEAEGASEMEAAMGPGATLKSSSTDKGDEDDAKDGEDHSISEEERKKIKELPSWVRPMNMPLQKGSFELVREPGSVTSSRWFELFVDQIMYYKSPPDSRQHASPFHAEGVIHVSDIKEITPMDTGFIIHLASGDKFILHGPRDGELQDWLDSMEDALGKAVEFKQAIVEAEQHQQPAAPKANQTIIEGPIRLSNSVNDRTHGRARLTQKCLQVTPSGRKGWPVTIEVGQIQAVSVGEQSFEVKTNDNSVHMLQVLDHAAVEEWTMAWEQVLLDSFDQKTEGQWTRKKATILHRGELDVVQDGITMRRYVVVYSDRCAVYPDIHAAKRKAALYQIWPVDVRIVRVHNSGIELGMDDDKVDFEVTSPKDLDKWFEAIKECFSRRIPEPESDKEEEEEEQVPEGDPLSEKFPDLPPSADPRALAHTCINKIDPTGKPTCQGILGFYDHGRLNMRYAVLYPTRLDTWDSVEDLLFLSPPKFSIKLIDVNGIETLSSGLILDVLEPIRKKMGIHVGHPQELRCWSTKILDALELVRASKVVTSPNQRQWQYSQRRAEPGPEEISGSLENGPGKRAGAPPGSQRSKSPNFLPRCAVVPPKDKKPGQDEGGSNLHLGNKRKSMKLLVHSPPQSHASRAAGVTINTHRAGQQAHAVIQRDKLTNPKDLSSGPGSSPRPLPHQAWDNVCNHTGVSPILQPRYSAEGNLPQSPTGRTREIRRGEEPGRCDWKKITAQDSSFRVRSTSPPPHRSPSPPQAYVDPALGWQKIGHENGRARSPVR